MAGLECAGMGLREWGAGIGVYGSRRQDALEGVCKQYQGEA